MKKPNIYHVDVFASQPLTGNGLTVILGSSAWTTERMMELTREMKQFESIFLSEITNEGATARIFTVQEELPFAGHPVLGAAVVLHRTHTPEVNEGFWMINLESGDVPVSTKKMSGYYLAEMNQGPAAWGVDLSSPELTPILERLSLKIDDILDGRLAQVISTGLPYLIIPVRSDALSKARIQCTDLEAILATIGAKFLVVLDVLNREMRTWDNLGQVEDIATGSAAGPVAAYLFKYGYADPNIALRISQGRFVGRNCIITVSQDCYSSFLVSGEVWPVSKGILEISDVEVSI